MSLVQRFSSGDVVENRYRLDICIHEGRWGDIYRATDQLNDRPVAIRFFPISEDGPADYDKFSAHARELSGLTAPSVSVPIDHGMEREIPYLVFRWAHGQDLQDRLAERGPLSFEQTLTVAEKMLKGLHHAHQSHLTHGLIRPVKVFVDDIDGDNPFVKLVDFQIWRFFEWTSGQEAFAEENLSRRIVRYTAPEVLDEHRVKPVTDLYATGLVIIEMLTGEPAFDDNHRVALIARQMSDELASLDDDHRAGTAFRDFLQQLVEKDETRRFASASKAHSAFQEQRDRFLSEPSLAEHHRETQSSKDTAETDEPDGDQKNEKSSSPEQASEAETSSKSEESSEAGVIQPADKSEPSTPDESQPPSDETTSKSSSKPPASKAENKSEDASEPGDAQPETSDEDVDPDTELFEGDPAKVRSLSDGRSLDDEDDELFDGDSDFGDFYSDKDTVSEPSDSAESTQASRSPERDRSEPPSDDEDDVDPSITEGIPKAQSKEKNKIIAVSDDDSPSPSTSRTSPASDSDISMGAYVAIIIGMLAIMTGAVYFVAFHDSENDEPTGEETEAVATDDEPEPPQQDEPDPIVVETYPPSITVIIETPTDKLKEDSSPVTLTEYSDDDFPLTIHASRGNMEDTVVLEEYTPEVDLTLSAD